MPQICQYRTQSDACLRVRVGIALGTRLQICMNFLDFFYSWGLQGNFVEKNWRKRNFAGILEIVRIFEKAVVETLSEVSSKILCDNIGK